MSEGAVKRPTLRDVAALAGVSFKTVSRVVNDEPGVSLELTRRVRSAVGELGYRTDPAASSLRRRDGRTGTIAVVIDDVANPFSAAMHRGVEDGAAERGVLVLAGSSDDDHRRERASIDTFTRRRVDGVVLMPVAASGATQPQQPALIGMPPIVAVDRPAADPSVDAIVVDNREATAAATAHLIAYGHRRIGLLCDAIAIYTAAKRLEGYREAVAAAGLPAGRGLVRTGLRSSGSAREATVAMLAGPNPPTAIVAARNELTIGAVHALRGLDRHRDVALISFDDLDLADLLNPALTVVAQDPAAIGRAAAKRLFARIDGEGGPARRVVVPTRLIERGSGEIRPPDRS